MVVAWILSARVTPPAIPFLTGIPGGQQTAFGLTTERRSVGSQKIVKPSYPGV